MNTTSSLLMDQQNGFQTHVIEACKSLFVDMNRNGASSGELEIKRGSDM
jgi:hypothetical protein